MDEEYDIKLPPTESSSSDNFMENIMNTVSSLKSFDVNSLKALVEKFPAEYSEPIKKLMSGGMANKEKIMAVVSEACAKMGVDLNSVASKIKATRAESVVVNREAQKGDVYVLRINSSRKVKTGVVAAKNLKKSVQSLLNNENVLQSSISSLCIGPWEKYNIYIWTCVNAKGSKNRRTSNLLEYDTPSEIVLSSNEKLTESDLEKVEKMLASRK